MALHHFAISLCDTAIDATKTPTMTWRTHSLFLSRRQVAAHVFTSFAKRMRSLFCVVSSSSSSSPSVPSSFKYPQSNRHQRVLVLSTMLTSLVSSSDPTCSHARVTPSSMLGMSRCNMVFNLKLGRPTSDYHNIGSLNLNRFVIQAFVHKLVFDGHDLQLCFWRLRRRVAVSLTHACRRPPDRCYVCIEHNALLLRVFTRCWILVYPMYVPFSRYKRIAPSSLTISF